VPEDDELARIVRRLAIEHAETRWLALRLDDDVKEIRGELRAVRAVQREHTDTLQEHTDTLQEHTGILQEHTGRFDSVDAQLRSLTQLVGQVLERLPDEPAG
jgi:methyl-accepting chemotaxis protein